MIRKDIEYGTEVWNLTFGRGVFKEWDKNIKDIAIIILQNNYIVKLTRKELTEIEPESF